jgi:hypothetical protein
MAQSPTDLKQDCAPRTVRLLGYINSTNLELSAFTESAIQLSININWQITIRSYETSTGAWVPSAGKAATA